MKEVLLTVLRNKDTKIAAFRSASDRLAELIAAEATQYVSVKPISIQTPLAACIGKQLKNSVVLVPILRAGLALLPAFMKLFPDSSVGFLGINREENSATPHQYYEKFPSLSGEEDIFLLDPMIATGGSAIHSIKRLIQCGAKAQNIQIFGILTSQSGVQAIHQVFPEIHIHCIAQDPELNAASFITPGLGDFGDRYFFQ
ncbi:MAG: uracil phosphoribosyltransferase [Nitrosarchaeum sp.]|nr:uracil phosphoribosyltransferase [Nitrosarchaeum sp.]